MLNLLALIFFCVIFSSIYKLCLLQIEVIWLLHFQFWWSLLLSFSYVIALAKTFCALLIGMVNISIILIFWILEEKLLTFTVDCGVSCQLLINGINCVDLLTLYSYGFVCLPHDCVLSFVKCLFFINWDNHVIFILCYHYVLHWFNCIYWTILAF